MYLGYLLGKKKVGIYMAGKGRERAAYAGMCRWLPEDRKHGSKTLSKTPKLKSLLDAGKIRTYMQQVLSTMERNTP